MYEEKAIFWGSVGMMLETGLLPGEYQGGRLRIAELESALGAGQQETGT